MTQASAQGMSKETRSPIPAYVIGYSDSAFSNAHSVVFPNPPEFDANAFTFVGKEMDGIESRRHSTVKLKNGASAPCFEFDPNTFNWFEIGLKQRAKIDKLHISTRWFTGNQVRKVSVTLKDEMTGKETEVLSKQTLQPDNDHEFAIAPTAATEIRVHCHYDGGISRFHAFGEVIEQMPVLTNLLETATVSHVSNEHYGKPAQAIAGNRQVGHMLGWESARTGFGEQALFQLAKPSAIKKIHVDTYMHVFNSPLSCHVFALSNKGNKSNDELMKSAPRWKVCFADGKEVIPEEIRKYVGEEQYLAENGNAGKFEVKLHTPEGSEWKPLLPFAALNRDTMNRFTDLANLGEVTHVLFMYFPNGGIHGLKMYGG